MAKRGVFCVTLAKIRELAPVCAVRTACGDELQYWFGDDLKRYGLETLQGTEGRSWKDYGMKLRITDLWFGIRVGMPAGGSDEAVCLFVPKTALWIRASVPSGSSCGETSRKVALAGPLSRQFIIMYMRYFLAVGRGLLEGQVATVRENDIIDLTQEETYHCIYNEPRYSSFEGYNVAPRIDCSGGFGGLELKSIRQLLVDGEQFEVVSPNSRRRPYYPGSHPMAPVPPSLRFDGHLGPGDPTVSPQYYDARRPWLPMIPAKRLGSVQADITQVWEAVPDENLEDVPSEADDDYIGLWVNSDIPGPRLLLYLSARVPVFFIRPTLHARVPPSLPISYITGTDLEPVFEHEKTVGYEFQALRFDAQVISFPSIPECRTNTYFVDFLCDARNQELPIAKTPHCLLVKDIKRLLPGRFLNDRIIQFALEGFPAVKSWAHPDLQKKRFLILPIHDSQDNIGIWLSLGYLKDILKASGVCPTNSLGQERQNELKKIEAYIKFLAEKQKYKFPVSAGTQLLVPRQSNNYDCGIHLLHYAREFLWRPQSIIRSIIANKYPSTWNAESEAARYALQTHLLPATYDYFVRNVNTLTNIKATPIEVGSDAESDVVEIVGREETQIKDSPYDSDIEIVERSTETSADTAPRGSQLEAEAVEFLSALLSHSRHTAAMDPSYDSHIEIVETSLETPADTAPGGKPSRSAPPGLMEDTPTSATVPVPTPVEPGIINSTAAGLVEGSPIDCLDGASGALKPVVSSAAMHGHHRACARLSDGCRQVGDGVFTEVEGLWETSLLDDVDVEDILQDRKGAGYDDFEMADMRDETGSAIGCPSEVDKSREVILPHRVMGSHSKRARLGPMYVPPSTSWWYISNTSACGKCRTTGTSQKEKNWKAERVQ
ncbi:hypothetical protein R3P38DRAFT_2803062 [Favolaschia claudopus]|uniref:Ubiquitin-like protease family profile domain-containing protein n=1 Tax=Favolaschia claudopus TaxID=2862362 RepID=A0AAV9ZU14_9AGAR